LNVRGRLQKHSNNGNSIQGLRFDVLDAINSGGKPSLCDAEDVVAHIFRNEIHMEFRSFSQLPTDGRQFGNRDLVSLRSAACNHAVRAPGQSLRKILL
jgi:hypothetical protein